MKLHVHVGPLPLVPPYFGWEEELEIDLLEDEFEEIDLSDLFDRPADKERMH
jgi:hypothetical protein